MSWPIDAGVVSSLIPISGAVWRFMAKPAICRLTAHMAQEIKTEVHRSTQELRPNGGGSLKDTANLLDNKVNVLQDHLREQDRHLSQQDSHLNRQDQQIDALTRRIDALYSDRK